MVRVKPVWLLFTFFLIKSIGCLFSDWFQLFTVFPKMIF